MNLLEQLRGNFPKTIDKSKPVFSGLIANDNHDAAIQKELEDLFAYMKEWISTPNIYEQTGVMLDKSVKFFSFIERFADETETSLKNRLAAIFIRNHDKKWGTAYDIKSVFKQYFPHATIYLVENTNKIDDSTPELANLFDDGDIDTDTPTAWHPTDCTATTEARFSKTYGMKLDQAGGNFWQTVNVPNREQIGETENYKSCVYYIHFFLKGKVNVQIHSSANNKYWNFETKTWDASPVDNTFEQEEWNDSFVYFITEGDDDTTDITVTFSYADELGYVDYLRFFKKQPFGSFTVIAYFEGNTSVGVFGLAPGEDDPNPLPQPKYSRYGYYDKSFLSGVPIGFATDIYEELLDYLRAQGVKAYLEIVIKDYIEDEE